MAANVRIATCRSFCEDALIKLFNDTSAEVRTKAAECFLRFEGTQLGEYVDLITQFVSSRAFQQNYYPLLEALEKTTSKLPEVSLSACERLADTAGLATSEINVRGADTVVKLTLRTYQQSSDDSVQARSLTLIDKFMEHGTYGINKALEDFER